jgi:hypothetical protein
MRITTTRTAARNGVGNFVAKGAGRQRTVRRDPSKSYSWNHGHAAGTLAVALGLPAETQFSVSGDGNRAVFVTEG